MLLTFRVTIDWSPPLVENFFEVLYAPIADLKCSLAED